MDYKYSKSKRIEPKENLQKRLVAATVVRVQDGDTFYVSSSDPIFSQGVAREKDNTISIRLAGVGAPEGQSSWKMWDENGYLPYEEYEFLNYESKEAGSEEAFEFVKNLAHGKEVMLDIRTNKDGYLKKGVFGRPIAIAYVRNNAGEWINVNMSLLLNNLSEPYYVEDMNLSDEEKSLWVMLPFLSGYDDLLKVSDGATKDKRDDFLLDDGKSFDPEREIKIGDTILPIPPEQISVIAINDVQPTDAIRNGTTMLNSTGHITKQIQLTMYFNFKNKKHIRIDDKILVGDEVNGFPKKAKGEYSVILQDGKEFTPIYYINGLRPLLAQFRLTPFLPIENNYLNHKHGIEAITLQNISITTVPDFPGLLKVILVGMEFNYQVYIDALSPFKDIFDWELFRFYYQRIIEGTGIKHEGTKLPFFEDNSEFSFESISLWSLQKKENIQNSLKNIVTDYHMDLENGESAFEKMMHDLEMMTWAKRQYDHFHEIKNKYDLDNIGDLTRLYNEYINYCNNNGPKKILYRPQDYEYINATAPSRPPSHWSHTTLQDTLRGSNFGKTEGYFDFRLRSPENVSIIRSIVRELPHTELKSHDMVLWHKTDSDIEQEMEKNNYYRCIISALVFPKALNVIVDIGGDIIRARDEAIAVAEEEIDIYEWVRHTFQDLILSNITLTMSNNINSFRVNMQSKPAHQYLGSKDVIIAVDFITTNANTVKSLSRLVDHIKAMELRFKEIIDRPLLKINNNVAQLLDLDGVYIKDIQTDTVPGMPGLFQISMSMFGYYSGPQNYETLSRGHKTEIKKDRRWGVDVLTDYFDMKEKMLDICLYPDLELPRYSELPIHHPLYDPRDHTFVDPDFYALNVSNLMVHRVLEAIYSDEGLIIGRDYNGVTARGKVNPDGGFEVININESPDTEEPVSLGSIAKDREIGYKELLELAETMDDENSPENNAHLIPRYTVNEEYIEKNNRFRNKFNVYIARYSDITGDTEKIFNKKIGVIGELLLTITIFANWHPGYRAGNNYIRIESGEFLFDKDGNRVDNINDAYYLGLAMVPKYIVSPDDYHKVSSNYRYAIARFELEAHRIANILMQYSPNVAMSEKTKILPEEYLMEQYGTGGFETQYYYSIFKLIAYLIIHGLTLDDIKNQTPLFNEMLKRYKYAFDAVEIDAFRDIHGGRQVNFRVLLTQLPSIVSVITDNLKEIEGKIFMHETPKDFLQQRDKRSRFIDAFYDMLEYDKRGRLIRAFPTYYMLLIDEGRRFYFWRMQDIFYEYNGIESIEIVRDRKNVADTCLITLTNSKGNLSNATGAYRKKSFNDMGVFETLWSLTPFAEYEWEKKKRDYEFKTMQLQTGARIHLRIGYGSSPDRLPVVFNGTITELQLGDMITFVAQGDGIELNKPIPAGPKEKTDYEFFGEIQEPKEIITDILGNRGNIFKYVINKLSGNLFYNDNDYGIQHFGIINRPKWWDESTYISMRHPRTRAETRDSETISYEEDPPRGYEVSQNINSAHYPNTRFALYLYGKTVWDVIQSCAMVAPNYIAAVHPFGFRSTIFYGHPNFDFAYDYEAPTDEYGRYIRTSERREKKKKYFSGDGKETVFNLDEAIIPESVKVRDSHTGKTHSVQSANPITGKIVLNEAPSRHYGNVEIEYEVIVPGHIDPTYVREKIKPYRQLRFYSGFFDIIANNIIATSKRIATAVVPVMSKDGTPKELDTIYLDTDIFPEHQKVLSIDTSISTPDLIRRALQLVELQEKEEQICARRYAMSALKQAVQNMYDGELIILGDPSVKPYDYAYLADIANSMSGMFEVETVVHLISKSTGFITSITPAPIVSVNEGLKEDVEFWVWCKSKFSSIYQTTVAMRLLTASVFQMMQSVMAKLSAADSFMLSPFALDSSYRMTAEAIGRSTNVFNQLSLTHLGRLLGVKTAQATINAGKKFDEFITWLRRFLDSLGNVDDIAKLEKGADMAKILSKTSFGTSNVPGSIASGLGYAQNGYRKAYGWFRSVADDAAKLPGLTKDIRKFAQLKKAGESTLDIVKNANVFRRLLGYGIKGTKDIAALLTGPAGIVFGLVIEYVVTKKITGFLNNKRENREVLTMMLLNYNGEEFSAGIDGHMGCVIGDDPGKLDKFWNSSLMNFLIGESKTEEAKRLIREEGFDWHEGIDNLYHITHSRQELQLAIDLLNVNSLEELKERYEAAFLTKLEELTTSNTMGAANSVNDIDMLPYIEPLAGQEKSIENPIKGIEEIPYYSREQWIQEAYEFINNNREILEEYKGMKLHPRLIDTIKNIEKIPGIGNISISTTLPDDLAKRDRYEDIPLFDTGLAIYVSKGEYHKYKSYSTDLGDHILSEIIKVLPRTNIRSFKVFSNGSMQIDLVPLDDLRKLRTDYYRYRMYANTGGYNITTKTLEAIKTWYPAP